MAGENDSRNEEWDTVCLVMNAFVVLIALCFLILPCRAVISKGIAKFLRK